jgi:steroid 5-alpha reductase family enzyme
MGKMKRDPYASQGRSIPQHIFLTAAAGVALGAAWWVLFDHGVELAAAVFHQNWQRGNDARRLCLAIALAIYFVRLLFTQFLFLKRRMAWGEALAIAPWILLIYLGLAFCGGANPAPYGTAAVAGCVLFLLGSWMNSYAEYSRHEWKKRPENRGQLYTMGLFRYSRHPNYLGDLISFSGLCLIAGSWPTFLIPLIMLAGFVFVNIPMLDSHLHDHYGAAFDAYAARTSKLVPFLY